MVWCDPFLGRKDVAVYIGTQLIFSLFFTYLYLELPLPIALSPIDLSSTHRLLPAHRQLPSTSRLFISIDHISTFLTSSHICYRQPIIDASFTPSPPDIVPASLALAPAPASHQLRPRSPNPLVKDLLDRYRYLSRPFVFQAPTCPTSLRRRELSGLGYKHTLVAC